MTSALGSDCQSCNLKRREVNSAMTVRQGLSWPPDLRPQQRAERAAKSMACRNQEYLDPSWDKTAGLWEAASLSRDSRLMHEADYRVKHRFRSSSALRFGLRGESPSRHGRQIMARWASFSPAEWRADPKAGK